MKAAAEIIESLCRELDELRTVNADLRRSLMTKKASTEDLQLWLDKDFGEWKNMDRWGVSRELDRRLGEE